MSDETYNGWKNYPTWAVHLWLTNEQGLDNLCRDLADEATENEYPRHWLTVALKDVVREGEENVEGMYGDLLGYALDCVDWYEIADAFLEEVEVPA